MADMSVDFAAWLQGQLELIPARRAALVARRAGISPGYLSALKTRVKDKPSSKTITAIVRGLVEIRNLDNEGARQLQEEAFRAAEMSAPVEVVVKDSTEPPPSLEGFDRMLWLVAHRRCPCCGKPQ